MIIYDSLETIFFKPISAEATNLKILIGADVHGPRAERWLMWDYPKVGIIDFLSKYREFRNTE